MTATHVMALAIRECIIQKKPFPRIRLDRSNYDLLLELQDSLRAAKVGTSPTELVRAAIDEFHQQKGHDVDQRLAHDLLLSVVSAARGVDPSDVDNRDYKTCMNAAANVLVCGLVQYAPAATLADHMIQVGGGQLAEPSPWYQNVVTQMIDSGHLSVELAEYEGQSYIAICFEESDIDKRLGIYGSPEDKRAEMLPIRLKRWLNESHFGWPEFILSCIHQTAYFDSSDFDRDNWVLPVCIEYRKKSTEAAAVPEPRNTVFVSVHMGVIGRCETVAKNSRGRQALTNAQRFVAETRNDLELSIPEMVQVQAPRNLLAVMSTLDHLIQRISKQPEEEITHLLRPNVDLFEAIDQMMRIIYLPITKTIVGFEQSLAIKREKSEMFDSVLNIKYCGRKPKADDEVASMSVPNIGRIVADKLSAALFSVTVPILSRSANGRSKPLSKQIIKKRLKTELIQVLSPVILNKEHPDFDSVFADFWITYNSELEELVSLIHRLQHNQVVCRISQRVIAETHISDDGQPSAERVEVVDADLIRSLAGWQNAYSNDYLHAASHPGSQNSYPDALSRQEVATQRLATAMAVSYRYTLRESLNILRAHPPEFVNSTTAAILRSLQTDREIKQQEMQVRRVEAQHEAEKMYEIIISEQNIGWLTVEDITHVMLDTEERNPDQVLIATARHLVNRLYRKLSLEERRFSIDYLVAVLLENPNLKQDSDMLIHKLVYLAVESEKQEKVADRRNYW